MKKEKLSPSVRVEDDGLGFILFYFYFILFFFIFLLLIKDKKDKV